MSAPVLDKLERKERLFIACAVFTAKVITWTALILLVQPELERGRSPLVSIPPCGRGFSRHEGLPIRCGLFEERGSEAAALRSSSR